MTMKNKDRMHCLTIYYVDPPKNIPYLRSREMSKAYFTHACIYVKKSCADNSQTIQSALE
jgi:hypothetical protein